VWKGYTTYILLNLSDMTKYGRTCIHRILLDLICYNNVFNLYKKTIMPKYRGHSIHHLIARSDWWSNEPENLKQMQHKQHVRHHQYFWNKRPKQQLYEVFKLNKRCLTPEIREAIAEVLAYPETEYRYKEWVWVPKKKELRPCEEEDF
jgi:hypothetical protein